MFYDFSDVCFMFVEYVLDANKRSINVIKSVKNILAVFVGF